MFEAIKELLIQDPQHIANLLEFYGFAKINITKKEIRCAFEDDRNPSSVVIRLENNEKLYVKDYGRNIENDLMGYISVARSIPLGDVIKQIKIELGVDNFFDTIKKRAAFGGLFELIGNRREDIAIPVLPESILKQYDETPNEMFYNDGISIKTQERFGIGYSIDDQRITIPIRNACGELIGVKGRCNYVPRDCEPKYLYLYPCPMSQTLFGYSENYSYMYGKTVIITESEKSVMQGDTMGYHNIVALGSNSLSEYQAKLIATLNPETVVFALDNSLPLENTFKNIRVLSEWCVLSSTNIKYFDWTKCNLLEEKDSPTDRGKDVFMNIMENNLVNWKGERNEGII